MERILLNDKLNNIIKKNVDMKKYTTFKTGGYATYGAFPTDVAELALLVSELNKYSKEYIILGNGSNVLVSDKGVDSLVIFLTSLKGVSVFDNHIVTLSGNMMSEISKIALKNSLSGMEFMSGIPGTVGGGVYMNAGAYGSEIKDIIESVKCMDKYGNIKTYDSESLNMEYRKSIFSKTDDIIIEATFKLSFGSEADIKEKMKEFNKSRREKQPLNFPNAGSTFKRPEGNFAGKLIEDAGLKGYTVGGAMVSEKHCGFIINYNNATSSDIYNLISYIQNVVFEKFNIWLEPEIKFIGEF